METVLTWLLVLLVTSAAVTTLAAWLAVRRLRRRLRLHPRVPSGAPLRWLASPERSARLHRRLQAAVAAAHFRPPGRGRRRLPSDLVTDLIDELVGEAVAVDDQLVVAARAPRAVRRNLLDTLEPQIAQLEGISGRLVGLVSATARPGGSPPAVAIRELEERLSTLESARQEIADLEALLRLDRT